MSEVGILQPIGFLALTLGLVEVQFQMHVHCWKVVNMLEVEKIHEKGKQ